MGGDVVMNMVKNLEEGKNYKLFADNLFSSLNLVKQLKEKGIMYVGTVRENRLKGCKLKREKALSKEGRGAMDSKVDTDSNITVVRWYDNKKVDVISSFIGAEPVANVNRWDKKAKKKVEVHCPAVIRTYNKHMGGVDLLDSLTALSKSKIKTRRWYIYLFYHTINMIVVTSWLMCRRHCKLLQQSPVKLSDFQQLVADSLLMVERLPGRPAAGSPRLLQSSQIQERRPAIDVRLDRVDHMPMHGTRQWCKNPSCCQKSSLLCAKCNIHLCLNKERNCLRDYHTKKTL
ncbi:hypothetical protein RRG08_001690 [Elysia crispata]|uniref:PiggyBac transposable element-derived protein domain-containing protein n=1 Tax=Elysia crispata TaxID=231223 RepID=A0AAE1E0Q4_9GAST|nr:hypothetical protein RRG08_001690 [Elysia crispata]